ncbi:anti-sigma factor domain-containing protein [Lewinella cohaerens]|uniref:anti-sigma factor domain-containing protein n=1 Tax=Lewinella cohaerens TaxID=70995 RepID=UPI0003754850|nr:anti-sigma factor [Lewinella cohaerens]
MDKEQFLNSGLLEQYVLGLTSSEEDQIVQQYLEVFPELNSEVNVLHQAMQQYAMQQSIAPPKSQPPPFLSDSSKPARDIIGNFNWSRLVIVGLLGLSFFFFRTNQQQGKAIMQVEAEYAALKTYCQASQSKVHAQQLTLEKVHHPHTTSILLSGTTIAPGFFALAHWNPTLKEGWIDPTKLPTLPKGKQYQVWADVDGEMISVGLIPPQSQELISITYIAHAASINITAEELGGADHPNVSMLTVNGYL